MRQVLALKAAYRVDLLAPDGTLYLELTIDCAHDDEAIDRVGEFDYPYEMDIWQGDRRVAHFPIWLGSKFGFGPA